MYGGRRFGPHFLYVIHLLEGSFPKPRKGWPAAQTIRDDLSSDADKVAFCDDYAGSLPITDPPLQQKTLNF